MKNRIVYFPMLFVAAIAVVFNVNVSYNDSSALPRVNLENIDALASSEAFMFRCDYSADNYCEVDRVRYKGWDRIY